MNNANNEDVSASNNQELAAPQEPGTADSVVSSLTTAHRNTSTLDPPERDKNDDHDDPQKKKLRVTTPASRPGVLAVSNHHRPDTDEAIPSSPPPPSSHRRPSAAAAAAEPGIATKNTTASTLQQHQQIAGASHNNTSAIDNSTMTTRWSSPIPASRPKAMAVSGVGGSNNNTSTDGYMNTSSFVQDFESDLLVIKQKEQKNRTGASASTPGAVAAAGTAAVSKSLSSTLQEPASEPMIKQSASLAATTAKNTSFSAAATLTTTGVDTVTTKQRISKPATQTGAVGVSQAVAEVMEADLMANKQAAAAFAAPDTDVNKGTAPPAKNREHANGSRTGVGLALAADPAYETAQHSTEAQPSRRDIPPGAMQGNWRDRQKTREEMDSMMDRQELENALRHEKEELLNHLSRYSGSFQATSSNDGFIYEDSNNHTNGQRPVSVTPILAPQNRGMGNEEEARINFEPDDDIDNKQLSGPGASNSFHDQSISNVLAISSQDDLDVPVNARMIDEEAERERLPGADRYYGKDTIPFYRRGKFTAVVTCLICVMMGAVIAGTVVSVQNNKDRNDGLYSCKDWTSAPAMSPTLAPASSDEIHLRAFLELQNISQATLDSAPVAYEMAIRWYANEDRGRNRSIPGNEYPWDLERFVMSWFYYATSGNGTRRWTSCNPPDYDRGDNDTCTYLKFDGVSTMDRSFIKYKQVAGTPRWLSKYKTHEWAGLSGFELVSDELLGMFPWFFPYAQSCNFRVNLVDLQGMGLSGPLPVMLNQLYCVSAIYLSWNPGLTGSIAPEFFRFQDRKDTQGIEGMSKIFFNNFGLMNNSGMSGPIPSELWTLPGLQYVLLSDAGLSGTIPRLDATENAEGLERLWLSGNSFGGGELPILSGFEFLESLRLNRNQFNGTIPTEYGTLTALQELWLFGNDLTGEVSSLLEHCQNLKQLRLHTNYFRGTFPNIVWPSLTRLELYGNQFSGELPPSLAKMTNLKDLHLHENKFNGTISNDIGNNLVNLEKLLLDDNRFTGTIPSTLAKLSKLITLRVNFNNFTGDFPFEICRLRSKDGLSFIFGDCLGYPPHNYCFCCTTCCDPTTRYCEVGHTIEREDEQISRHLTVTRWEPEEALFVRPCAGDLIVEFHLDALEESH